MPVWGERGSTRSPRKEERNGPNRQTCAEESRVAVRQEPHRKGSSKYSFPIKIAKKRKMSNNAARRSNGKGERNRPNYALPKREASGTRL